MFELNQEIEKWQAHLQQTKSLRDEDVQEIKSHLVDSVIDLTENGLSQEEAFFVAKHRMGDLNVLNTEYAKVNTGHIWRRRFMWLITGYFLFGSLPIIMQIVSQFIHNFNVEQLLHPTTILWGPRYSAPYSTFVVTLLVVGLGMYFLMREKDSSINELFAFQSRNKLMIGIITAYVTLILFQVLGWRFMDNNLETFGNAAQSGALFEVMWELSLILILAVLIVPNWWKSKPRLQTA